MIAPQTAASAPAESSSVPYVLPFAAFCVFLLVAPYLTFLGVWEYPIRVVALIVIVLVFSRNVIDLRTQSLISSIVLGVAVFVLWIAPDTLFASYRDHWLFTNPVTGGLSISIASEHRRDWIALIFRSVRAIILVPVIEELFWRAWMMRWLISPRFEQVPLGTFSWTSMIVTAVLFASEHGPYWDVGLLTGLIYNAWMIRTRSLGDCIVAHAVTNACLCLYVVITQRWEYWM